MKSVKVNANLEIREFTSCGMWIHVVRRQVPGVSKEQCLVIEDEGAKFFRNIGSHSVNDKTSHPKDLCSQLHHRN